MLLLDENLSPRLIARIQAVFPGSLHVIHAKLDNSPDIDLWNFAKNSGLAIVTKDKDFLPRLDRLGPPPKIIYLTTGNVRIAVIESLLMENKQCILDFLQDAGQSLLEL